jgi:hypothetical protein
MFATRYLCNVVRYSEPGIGSGGPDGCGDPRPRYAAILAIQVERSPSNQASAVGRSCLANRQELLVNKDKVDDGDKGVDDDGGVRGI